MLVKLLFFLELLVIRPFYHLIAWQSKGINFVQVFSRKKVADIQLEEEYFIPEAEHKIERFDMYFTANSQQPASSSEQQAQLDYTSAEECQKDILANASKIQPCVMIDQVPEEILAIPVESS